VQKLHGFMCEQQTPADSGQRDGLAGAILYRLISRSNVIMTSAMGSLSVKLRSTYDPPDVICPCLTDRVSRCPNSQPEFRAL
jgi:hypothetical protein